MIAPLLLLLLCHLKQKSEPCSPLQLSHTGRLVVVLSFIAAISPDRKLLPDEHTKSQEVTASHRKPMFRGVTLPWRDVFLYNLMIFESVTSPCNDDYKVAARDAKYTLHFQTQGQGDIQTTGTFYTGIFITSSKACEGNEGVLRGVALVNIGPCDGKEWGLKEVSHSQWAVIKESSSFFSAGKGEAHLIKTEMF